MTRKTKIWIGIGVILAVVIYFTTTSIVSNLNRYNILENNNTVLKANQEFYKRQWEEQKQKRKELQTELDGVLVQIDSLKGLRPAIIYQREQGKQKILGLPNSQMQSWYDNKVKQLQK